MRSLYRSAKRQQDR
ncbi:hypothetical protein QTP70_021941 [Hemibagrus guttatus]|uniref:Uncharacterized protein n=1 Tax=Hemibagrus guttatus TaxID=175788 RepID=A0AAE0UT11_9TELE|nr:hypothetical protein QTP70_021941 [Hemibagrus guttatus]